MASSNVEVDTQPQSLHARSLRDLLDETFTIYSRHPLQLLALVAAVQVPAGLVSSTVLEGLGGSAWAAGVVVYVRLLSEVLAYAAAVMAVGYYYVGLRMNVGKCYRRVWLRILSLMALSAVVAVALGIVPLVVLVKGQAFIGWLALLVVFPVMAFTIYWWMGVQAVMLEVLRPLAALGRSYALVRGTWWRVFGFAMLLGLVSLGLGIVVSIVFAVPLWVSGTAAGSTMSDAVQYAARVAVTIAVLPVIFISSTLLYYDLRVRKEGYNLAGLLKELGVAAAR